MLHNDSVAEGRLKTVLDNAGPRATKTLRSDQQAGAKISQVEAVRGAAALYVLVYHSSLPSLFPGIPLLRLGSEAVILFFILSGFVISYSSDMRLSVPGGVFSYIRNRVRRIYPLFVVALAVTFLLNCWRAGSLLPFDYKNCVLNLAMLQDLTWMKEGAWAPTFGGNDPLWSLSYEWWFYIAFIPLVRYVPFKRQRRAALLLSALCALSYFLVPSPIGLFGGYFFIWWSGVELSRQYRDEGELSFRGQRNTFAGLFLIIVCWSVPVIAAVQDGEKLSAGLEPVIQLRHAIGAFLLLFFGILWYRFRLIGFQRTIGVLQFLAPISYALYIMHMPFVRACEGVSVGVELCVYALLLVPLCCVCEIWLQPLLSKQVARMFDSISTSAKAA